MKLFDFSKKNVEKNAEKEAKVKENKVEDTQKKSDSVETIVCPNCGKTLLKDVVKKGIQDGNFSIKYFNEDVKIALAISHEFVTVGLFKLDGTYDQNRLLLSNRKKAISWGLTIFDSYDENALPLILD